jgi:hypothetical protein
MSNEKGNVYQDSLLNLINFCKENLGTQFS